MAPRDSRDILLDALAVTAELTGTELSKPAARIMLADLEIYPLEQVTAALTRCRRELRGRLTIAAIVERLDDGRPGPNEAWAMIPQDERGSVVWTDEMAAAHGVAAPLLHEGQVIAARMAFLECYAENVAVARAAQKPPHWTPSLGHDPATRTAAIEDAVRHGRMTEAHALTLLPGPDRDQAASNMEMLTGPRSPMPEALREKLRASTKKLTVVR